MERPGAPLLVAAVAGASLGLAFLSWSRRKVRIAKSGRAKNPGFPSGWKAVVELSLVLGLRIYMDLYGFIWIYVVGVLIHTIDG